jgi:hypothetical protein
VSPREIGAATSSSQFFRSIGSTVGVAVFGTILAVVLSARLPTYLPAGIQKTGAGAAAFSLGELESGNVSSVGDRIKARTAGTYEQVEAALTRHDEAARESLVGDPLLPEAYKAMLGAGGPPETATPVPSADVPRVLAGIRASLDRVASVLTAQVETALRKAFTDAVRRVYFFGMFVVAAGLAFTLFLPQRALRKTNAHAGAPQRADPGSAEPQRVAPEGGAAVTAASEE